jgi:hypothetical protein
MILYAQNANGIGLDHGDCLVPAIVMGCSDFAQSQLTRSRMRDLKRLYEPTLSLLLSE